MPRIGALHRKVEHVIGRQRVARIDPHLSFVPAIRHIQREELHRGAAVFGYFHLLALGDAPVQDQRHAARGLFRAAETGDCRQNPRLLVVVDAPGRHHVFHREVGRLFGFHAVRMQLHVGIQPQVVEILRPAGLLHIGVEMHSQRQVQRL